MLQLLSHEIVSQDYFFLPTLQALITKLPDIIRTIINWTMDYLRENVIGWIRDQGGWVSK